MASFVDENFADPSNSHLGERIKQLLGGDSHSVEVLRGPDPGSLILRLWVNEHCPPGDHTDLDG